MWTGCLTALVTPFADGGVDYDALERLVERQITAGVHGLVPCGSTGESATLTHEEHADVVRAVVEVARRRVPVIAGTGSNATTEAVTLTRRAEAAGADGALLISPYYVKPTQEGIYRHYAAVADASKLPLVVYNIPGRTASNVTPETMGRLARIPTVVGVKEASGSLEQVLAIRRLAGHDFAIWAGDDALTLPVIACGGHGVISVTSNVVPDRFARMVSHALAGDLAPAREEMEALLPLLEALFLEVNPIPVKTALHLMGFCRDELRLPLTPLTEGSRRRLRAVLGELGLV
jgi:4-hydroxy-tetrahydrodipicolinate synthase